MSTNGATHHAVTDAEPQALGRRCVAWDELDGRVPPIREWDIPHWIPKGFPTLLTGRGGIGKTLLAQHIASGLALGSEYLEPLTSRRVLMWAGEDDEAELWRRQRDISQHFGQPLSALTERFYLHSFAGEDMTLAGLVFGELQPTGLLEELRAQVMDYRAEFIILDNSARVFGGSENDRHAVTTFLAWLQGACRPATVLLLAHPAKANGSEFSGSTAWEGAVRARLYLSDRPPDAPADADVPPDETTRYLARRKANYSGLDIRRLTLRDGVMIPEPVVYARTSRPSGEFAKDIVRRAARKLAERQIFGNAGNGSATALPRLARQYGLLDTLTEANFASTMRTMILAGELVSREVGKYSNRTPKLGLVIP